VVTFSTQLPDYNASSLSTVVYSGQICNKSSLDNKVAYNVNQYWNFETKFYNLTLNQDAFQGASFVGKVRIGNVSCSGGNVYGYPTSKVYWFASTYLYPGNVPFVTYSTAAGVGEPVYIVSEYLNHYVCGTDGTHEICLLQPYTKYGLSGHTVNSGFTDAQQANAEQALSQAFENAGISADMCNTDSSEVSCLNDGNLVRASISYDGTILVYANGKTCWVQADGKAKCQDNVVN
jgi:hypothetical protein